MNATAEQPFPSHFYAVRWDNGEYEPCDSAEEARRIAGLYRQAEAVQAPVSAGAWEPIQTEGETR